MNYPSINEYIEAIRFAEDNFDQLKILRPVLGEDGEPVMIFGCDTCECDEWDLVVGI